MTAAATRRPAPTASPTALLTPFLVLALGIAVLQLTAGTRPDLAGLASLVASGEALDGVTGPRLALGITWWLAAAVLAWNVVTGLAYLAARALGLARLAAAVGAVTASGLRRRLDRVVAGGVAVGALASPFAGIAHAQEAPPRLPPVLQTQQDADTPGPAPTVPEPAQDPRAPHRPHDAPHTWTIESGQNLWTIAAAVVREAPGATADVPTVDAYWRRLIAANAAILRSGDPDLVYPQEVLRLPALVDVSTSGSASDDRRMPTMPAPVPLR